MTNKKDFYPTPAHLAIKMVNMIDVVFDDNILEPSAGKGSIVDVLKKKNPYRQKIDCIESDEELQATLLGKGYNLIDENFLSYVGSKQYDTIIMNPPFSNGVKHVLKAWEIIYNGDVIALLNAETLKNPHSKERQLLNEIIANNGDIEYIQDAFKDAERKTGVEIALIHLRKRQNVRTDYFDGMKVADNADEPDFQGSQIAIPSSQIENSVMAFNKAIECKKQAILKDSEADYYSDMIRKRDSGVSDNDITKQTKTSMNEYVDNLRESAWRDIMHMTDFRRNLTEKVMKEIESQIEVVKKLEFTGNNIRKFLQRLVLNQKDIMNDCVLGVFDMFTAYYEENRVHIEGWKSNDVFFVGRRVVLPWMTELNYIGELKIRYQSEEKLRDIDKVINLLMGDKQTLLSSIKYNQRYEDRIDLHGNKFESKYCTMRFYKKGTAHFYFDKKFIDRLNLIVGRQRGWLPEADDQVPKEFWIMNNS